MNVDFLWVLAQQVAGSRAHRYKSCVTLPCPFAPMTHPSGRDSNPSMSLRANPEGPSAFHCFACGEHGNIIEFVSRLWVMGFPVAEPDIDALRESEALDLSGKVKRAVGSWTGRMVRASSGGAPAFEAGTWPDVELARFRCGECHSYAAGRGVSAEVAREMEIGFDSIEQRVVFPVRRASDRALLGLVGRAVECGKRPPYMNYWGFQAGRVLYGEHVADARSPVVVVEGPFDVAVLRSAGMNVVGLLGASPSEAQLEGLRGFPLVCLALDGDPAGAHGVRSCIRGLFGRVPVRVVDVPPGQEISEWPADRAFAAVAGARHILTA